VPALNAAFISFIGFLSLIAGGPFFYITPVDTSGTAVIL
jgi:hypothetical protein